MTYSFNEKTHTHKLGDKKLKGVTSIIGGIIAKPALIPWAVKLTCSYIKETLKDIKEIDKVLECAKKQHTKKKEDAGSSGKDVHNAIELYIKTGEVYKGEDPVVQKSFSNFLTWANKNSVVFLDSEKHVHNEDVGGIIDGVVLMDGKKWICDFKTGSGIYKEYFLQTAAYDLLLGEKIDGYVILNLKKDGTFDEQRELETEKWKEGFTSCVKLHSLLR